MTGHHLGYFIFRTVQDSSENVRPLMQRLTTSKPMENMTKGQHFPSFLNISRLYSRSLADAFLQRCHTRMLWKKISETFGSYSGKKETEDTVEAG